MKFTDLRLECGSSTSESGKPDRPTEVGIRGERHPSGTKRRVRPDETSNEKEIYSRLKPFLNRKITVIVGDCRTNL